MYLSAPINKCYYDCVLPLLRITCFTKTVTYGSIMTSLTHHLPNTLHVMHSWGGGLKRWVDDYCKYDKTSRNFQLQSVGQVGIPGQELHLFLVSSIGELQLLKRWRLYEPITSTSVYRLEYQLILEEIYSEYQITAVIVSSFIGHSLDVLSFGDMKKLVVCHDYYPFCPAINIHFDDVCSSCNDGRLRECFKDNNFNRFFPLARAEEWVYIRRSYIDLVVSTRVPLVVPTASVRHHLVQLAPALSDAQFVEIPHGVEVMRPLKDTYALPRGMAYVPKGAVQSSMAAASAHEKTVYLPSKAIAQEVVDSSYRPTLTRKPRIVVLGALSLQKGLDLFKDIHQQLTQFSDVYLVGCGDSGEIFSRKAGIHIVKEYSRNDLPRILSEISPDVALLLSTWPETYSYTLSELFMLKVPVVATNLGSFADRIRDGYNGFLVEPSSAKVLEKMKNLLEYKALELERVASTAELPDVRTVERMVNDYYGLFELPIIKMQKGQNPLAIAASFADDIERIRVKDLYILRESILLSRQIQIDSYKASKAPLVQELSALTTSTRIPLTARFPLLRLIKHRFPETWSRTKAKLIRLYFLREKTSRRRRS